MTEQATVQEQVEFALSQHPDRMSGICMGLNSHVLMGEAFWQILTDNYSPHIDTLSDDDAADAYAHCFSEALRVLWARPVTTIHLS